MLPSHIAHVVKQSDVKQPIHRAFLGKSALPTDEQRNIISADFDNLNRLVMNFDTGEQIITKSIATVDNLEQHLIAAPSKFVDYMQFDTSADITPVVAGLLTWNDEDGTLNLGMGNNNATQQIGLETYIRIYNNTGQTILNESAVGFSGAGMGDTVGGSLMIADGSINPLRFLGIATHDIPNGTTGYITNFGGINGVNTTGSQYGETWAAGDIIFVSPTTPGALTKVRPIPPQVTIAIGAVARLDSINGRLMVSPRIISQVVYGAFNSTSSQALTAVNTAQSVLINNTVEAFGITKGTSTLTVGTSALYVLDFALSVIKSNSNTEKVWVWLRRNGVDIPNTALTFTIAGNATELIISGNFHVKLLETQNIELMWAGTSTALSLDAEPATAFAPASAAVRCALFQIND